MNEIKYPRTEVMIVLGSNVYPLYVTDEKEDIEMYLDDASREEMIDLEAAIKVKFNKGLWYPGCGDKPYWTEWTVKKSSIKSLIKLPEPKINIDYGDDKEEEYEF